MNANHKNNNSITGASPKKIIKKLEGWLQEVSESYESAKSRETENYLQGKIDVLENLIDWLSET